MTDSSILDVFPAASIEARFVVSMAMAKNDVERALRDVVRAGEADAPDFTYRVRLSTGHLIEGLDALDEYSRRHGKVRTLMVVSAPRAGRTSRRLAAPGRRVGVRALKHVRDNTFHYPSPRSNYSPSSDAQLEDVLAAMGEERADVHVDYDTRHVTLAFADQIALALAMGKHAPTREQIVQQFEVTRDGAIAFKAWAEALVVAYFTHTGATFGRPEIVGRSADSDQPDAL